MKWLPESPRLPNSGNQSGGAPVPEWGTGVFLVPGAPGVAGPRFAATVQGEPVVARWNGTIYEILSPSATAQGYVAANTMPPGAIVYPSIYSYQTGQETSFAGINNGGLWFEPEGEARIFAWEPVNITGRNADGIGILLPDALASAATATVVVGTGGSGFNAAQWSDPSPLTSIMQAGDEREYEIGMSLLWFDLPAIVSPGSRAVVRVQAGAGTAWTGISSASSVADSVSYASANQMSNQAQTLTGGWDNSGLDIGMNLAGVQWHTVGDPIIRCLIPGDSTYAGVPPIVDPNSGNRTSWARGVNVAEAAQGQRFVLASYAEGGYTFDQYCDRIQHLIDNAPATLQDMCEVVAIPVLTWNQFPASGSDSLAIQTRFETMRSALLPLGIRCIPVALMPPGTDRQGAGQLTQYPLMLAYIAANGGVDMTPYTRNPASQTFADPAKSADGVHLDSDEGVAVGTAAHADWVTAIQTLGLI